MLSSLPQPNDGSNSCAACRCIDNRTTSPSPNSTLFDGHCSRVQGISFGSSYWPLNVRQSVEFAPAIQALLEDGFNTFLEVGPHPVLATSLKDCIKAAGKECRTLMTLRRNQPERESLYRAIMSVFAEGCSIDWSKLISPANFIPLPNYAWQREKYWLENDRGMQDRIATIDYPILGIQEAPGTPAWRNDLDHEPLQYLRDHVVTGMPVLPAAAYVEAMMELVAIQFPEAQCFVVRDFVIQAPMLIVAERGLDSVTSFEPTSQIATIRSLENGRLGDGQTHCTGRLVGFAQCQSIRADLEALRRGSAILSTSLSSTADSTTWDSAMGQPSKRYDRYNSTRMKTKF